MVSLEKTVFIYVLIFNTVLAKALFMLIFVLKKTLKGNNLTMGHYLYTMTENILAVEALRVFEQKSWENGSETMMN